MNTTTIPVIIGDLGLSDQVRDGKVIQKNP